MRSGVSLRDVRAAFPDGVATAKQLVAVGVPERTVYHRCLEGGPWQNPLPGVILLFTGRATRQQEVLAALLFGGPDSVVTGIEACRRHGMRRGPARPVEQRDQPEPVHLLVPTNRQLRDVGYVHVVRTNRMPQPTTRGGVPVAPAARSCIDASRLLRSEGEIAELLSDAVQRRLCTLPALSHELEAGSRCHTAMPRRVLKSVAEGVRSAAELAAKKLWPFTGLPEPWWNAPVHTADGRFLGTVDCWLDDVAMAWEIESSEWHLSPEAHDHTVERAAMFVAAGVVYTASKPKKIINDRTSVIATLVSTYAQAQARPRPPLEAKPAEGSPQIAGKATFTQGDCMNVALLQ